MEKITSFLHKGSIGDVTASLPTIKAYFEKTGNKANLYLAKDFPAFYYDGATHPTRDSEGKQVRLNEAVINMMIPLYKEQPYLNEVKLWEDEKIDVDLSVIHETYVGMPQLSINRWYSYVFPDLSCNTTKPWLTIPDTDKDFAKGKILITRTERYTVEGLDFSFLKEHEDECVFVGTMREYNNFCMLFDLNIKKLHINNFLELAQALKQCRFHMSNQTQAFQISQGMDIPRLLEVCGWAGNVIVYGEHAYDYMSQQGLEYLFNKMIGKEVEYIEKLKASLNK
jgi:hypothetical protein